MFRFPLGPAISILLALTSPHARATSQQASGSVVVQAPQAVAALQQAVTALTAGSSVTDATLVGTATRIAGSDTQTVSATAKATGIGQSRVDLALTSGERSEVRDISTIPPSGAWSGSDGISHPIAYHNLMTDPTWFFPTFFISRLLSNPSYAISMIGQETHNGQLVVHIVANQQVTTAIDPYAGMLPHLSQMDLYLDSTTLLPAAFAFSVHPDNNGNVDVPAEIRFSNYQTTSGVQVPFRVQQYMNNNLFLDFTFQSAQLNTGMTAGIFQLP